MREDVYHFVGGGVEVLVRDEVEEKTVTHDIDFGGKVQRKSRLEVAHDTSIGCHKINN